MRFAIDISVFVLGIGRAPGAALTDSTESTFQSSAPSVVLFLLCPASHVCRGWVMVVTDNTF
jgi:hypothetical protein